MERNSDPECIEFLSIYKRLQRDYTQDLHMHSEKTLNI